MCMTNEKTKKIKEKIKEKTKKTLQKLWKVQRPWAQQDLVSKISDGDCTLVIIEN